MLKVKFCSFSGYGVLLKTSYLSFQWPINEKRPWNSRGVCFILAILTISIQTKQNFAILFLRLVCLGFVKHTYININMARTELRWFGNITILYLSCKLNCNGAGNPARMWVIKKYTLLVIRKEHVFCLPFFFFLDLPLSLIVRGWLWERFYQIHVVENFMRLSVSQFLHNWQINLICL